MACSAAVDREDSTMRAMTMALGVLVAGLALAGPPPRQVAITVDDLPSPEIALSSEADLAARNARIVAALTGTRATGFVNEQKLGVQSQGIGPQVDLPHGLASDQVRGALVQRREGWLQAWLDAGLELGNHTFDHNGLTATPIDVYERSILDGERWLRPALAKRGQTPRWFRHPYLQAGQDDAVRACLDAFLADHGYRIAPVTVDNGEWIYARAYVLLLDAGRRDEAAALIPEYIDYMEAKFGFFEQASKRLFGREIAQILLIHANALNADALPRLLERIRRRGYVFVDLDTALTDPAYAHADGYRGRAGISWLHRWAMAEKKPKSFYEGEPAVPRQVLDLAGVDGE
jgi:peptidoglycan/xylan/chitin deacetylase (PgdA/CDA1 family)